MDASDKAAVRLVRRIAEKAVEPMTMENPSKTIGEWRKELSDLHMECVNYVLARRDAFGKESDDGQT